MRVVIVGDKIHERFGRTLRYVADKDAKRIFMRALNRGGSQARTQVRRSLVAQTGIKYGLIHKAVTEDKATPNKLAYSLIAVGDETTLGLFNATQRKKGASAAPWKKRRIFKGSFIIGAKPGDKGGGKSVYVRISDERGPLGVLWGPNIARELMKSPTINEWQKVGPFVLNRVEHELTQLFKRR